MSLNTGTVVIFIMRIYVTYLVITALGNVQRLKNDCKLEFWFVIESVLTPRLSSPCCCPVVVTERRVCPGDITDDKHDP